MTKAAAVTEHKIELYPIPISRRIQPPPQAENGMRRRRRKNRRTTDSPKQPKLPAAAAAIAVNFSAALIIRVSESVTESLKQADFTHCSLVLLLGGGVAEW